MAYNLCNDAASHQRHNIAEPQPTNHNRQNAPHRTDSACHQSFPRRLPLLLRFQSDNNVCHAPKAQIRRLEQSDCKLQSPRPKRGVSVVIEGETCADTGSDPAALYPDNADVSVVGVFSSLQTAQRVALSRMKAKGISVRELIGGDWTVLIDDSGCGGLTSPCGSWSVSIERHTIDHCEADSDATESD
jgi:hypothetical protein